MPVQQPSRSRIFLEMTVVLGLAALIYGLGYLKDNTALGLVSISAAWIVIGISLKRRQSGWGEYGLRRPPSWKRTLVLALMGAAVLHVLIRMLKPLITEHITGAPLDISRFEAVRGDFPALLLGLLIVWTVAAFGEEMVFRGYVLNRTADLIGLPGLSRWLWAVLLSSLVFGLGHIYQGWTGVILSGIAGMVYCGAYFLDGRCIWAPILIHGIYDTSAFLILFFGLDKGLL